MFNNEELSRVLRTFNDEISDKIFIYSNELESILFEIKSLEFKKDILNNFSVDYLLSNKNKIIEFVPELINDLNIIQFFKDNNALDIEQVKFSLENIKNNSFFKVDLEKISELYKRKEELDKKINLLKSVQNRECDFEQFVQMVEESCLNEEEKLIIFANSAYESIKVEKKQEVEKVEEASILNEEENIDEDLDTTYNHCLSLYNKCKETLSLYTTKYYDLINKSKEKSLAYVKSYAKLSLRDDESVYEYPEEKLLVKLFEIKEQINLVDILLEKCKIEFNKNNVEDLLINLEIIEEEILLLNKYSENYDNSLKEQEVVEQSNGYNIYYLIDEEGNLFFDIDDFTNEEKQKISNIIAKISKGMFDYKKGDKHSKVQTSYKDNNVFINKQSDIGVTYIILDKKNILVVNVDYYKNIYDSVQNILVQSSKLINDTKNGIIDGSLLEEHNTISREVGKLLKVGGNPKL